MQRSWQPLTATVRLHYASCATPAQPVFRCERAAEHRSRFRLSSRFPSTVTSVDVLTGRCSWAILLGAAFAHRPSIHFLGESCRSIQSRHVRSATATSSQAATALSMSLSRSLTPSIRSAAFHLGRLGHASPSLSLALAARRRSTARRRTLCGLALFAASVAAQCSSRMSQCRFSQMQLRESTTVWPNHALQRVQPSRRGCNRASSWAGSLGLGRYVEKDD